MQRCIFPSPTHSGRCVFRSIEALVSPDACPADTPTGIPSLVKRKRRRRRKFLHRTKKLLFFLGCAITRLIRFVKWAGHGAKFFFDTIHFVSSKKFKRCGLENFCFWKKELFLRGESYFKWRLSINDLIVHLLLQWHNNEELRFYRKKNTISKRVKSVVLKKTRLPIFNKLRLHRFEFLIALQHHLFTFNY